MGGGGGTVRSYFRVYYIYTVRPSPHIRGACCKRERTRGPNIIGKSAKVSWWFSFRSTPISTENPSVPFTTVDILSTLKFSLVGTRLSSATLNCLENRHAVALRFKLGISLPILFQANALEPYWMSDENPVTLYYTGLGWPPMYR